MERDESRDAASIQYYTQDEESRLVGEGVHSAGFGAGQWMGVDRGAKGERRDAATSIQYYAQGGVLGLEKVYTQQVVEWLG